MHQDRFTRKEHIKFHTFWTSVLDEPLTEIAPSTQWIGESINMVMKRKKSASAKNQGPAIQITACRLLLGSTQTTYQLFSLNVQLQLEFKI
jgi:hypothetical protein